MSCEAISGEFQHGECVAAAPNLVEQEAEQQDLHVRSFLVLVDTCSQRQPRERSLVLNFNALGASEYLHYIGLAVEAEKSHFGNRRLKGKLYFLSPGRQPVLDLKGPQEGKVCCIFNGLNPQS